MENNINNKNQSNFMKRILSILTLFILLSFSVNAVFQNEVLRYEFEEGSGNIIIDTGLAGLNNHGIRNGGTWQTGTEAKFGTYGFDFDGVNDYITSISGSETPFNMTISFWAKPDAQSGVRTLWVIEDTNERLAFHYDYALGEYQFHYIDTSLNEQIITLETSPFTAGTWTNMILSIDYNNNQVLFYRDNSLISNTTLPTPIAKTTLPKSLRLGADFNAQEDYNGDMDEFRVFDFLVSQTQVSNLYLNNNINLIQEISNTTIEITPSNLQALNIINSSTPTLNQVTNNFVNFDISLNYQATCELYINNNLEKSFNNVLGYSYETYLEAGNNTYFNYCYFDDVNNDTKYYELQNPIPFTSTLGNKTISFFLFDNNNNLYLGENLYLTTPCLKGYVGTYYTEVNKPYNPYIKKIVNGQANFNLPFTAKYEFCLVRGQINTQEDNFSQNFDIVEVNKNINLGNIIIDTNSQEYAFRLSDTDIYQVYEPSFWGKTWAMLFEMVIAFIIGIPIIVLGLRANNDKIVIAGVFVILAGMGVSLGGLFLGIL